MVKAPAQNARGAKGVVQETQQPWPLCWVLGGGRLRPHHTNTLVFYATKLALNCSCQYTEGGRSCSASTQLGRCACVDAGRMRCPSTVPTNRNWSGLLIAIACPGSGFVVRALSLGWLQASGVSSLRPNWTVTNLRSGEPAKGINAWA